MPTSSPVADTSRRGRRFILRQEGCPLVAYLDVAHIATIGPGATNRSRVATEYLRSIGVPDGKIVPGKTKLTEAQADQMFAAMLDHEYEPVVIQHAPADRTPYQFDASTSGTYNLGPKFMTWNWADLWRAGKPAAAGAYLADHYNTAGGKRVAGLVRRRKAEAALFLNGDYGDGGKLEGEPRAAQDAPDASGPDPVVKEAQELLTARGFDPGKVDGWMGKNTKAAVLAYQKAHPDLANDGIIGPATMAQLRRDANAVKDTAGQVAKKGAPAAAAAGGFLKSFGITWTGVAIAAGVVLVIAGVYFAWRYRDVWARRRNTATGKTVEV